MSWQIARTYVNLGILPPARLGRLPEIRDEIENPENGPVIDALKKSNQWMIDRYQRNIDELDRLVD